jgi:hypothetical protein
MKLEVDRMIQIDTASDSEKRKKEKRGKKKTAV